MRLVFSVFLAAMIITPLTTTVFTLGTIPALAITPEEILGDPKLEARARALSKQLRCLVCQNQSIDDSDADLARDLRIEVRRQITAGRSDEIIIDQIRQKYGDYVLFNPPLDRGTAFLWLAPIGFVGLGVLIIVLARRKLHVTASPDLGASDRARIETMLITRSNEKGQTQRMIEQMLENLSFASLPAIAGTIICGIGLTGLMLWIIERGRTHMQGSDQTFQIYKQVDLLQNERQQRDSERQNGTISAKEHANACHEIDKRLLALTLDMEQQQHEHQSILTPRIIMLSFLVPALSTFIYLFLGSPQSPDQPIAGRSAEIAAAKAGANKSQNEAAAALQKAISSTEQTPQNVEAWLLLAQAAGAVNDSETEIRALRNAIEITESEPSIVAMLAEALSRAADGQITVPARALIKAVLEANPNEPRAMFLAGLAKFQDGDNESAIRLWQNLLAKSQPDAPWISTVRDNIKSAAEAGNIPLDTLDNLQPTGPDAMALADAATMTEDEQNEMIAGMVQRLHDRLIEEPNDTDGWIRLARAYNVLGQAENALDALTNGAKFTPENLDLKLALLEQILNMGTTKAEIERAKLVLAKGEKIAPKNPQILFFKGHLAQLSGETERARTAWQKLQDILDPESDAAKALEAEIEKLPKPKN